MTIPSRATIQEMFQFSLEGYDGSDAGRQEAIRYVAYSLDISEEIVQEAVKFI